MARVSRHAVGNAQAQLDQSGGGNQVFLNQLLHEPQVASVEDLEFGLDAQVLENLTALAQVVWRRNVSAIAVAEVEAAAIESGDVGAILTFCAKIDDVSHAIFLAAEIA